MNTLRLYKTRTGFRWTYTHKNGRKLANGGQGYSRRCDMIRAVGCVFPDFVSRLQWFYSSWLDGTKVKVVDETGRVRK